MVRRILVAAFRVFLRIFYRRIETTGIEHVPHGVPVIFAANHPNGLIDPLVLLCFAPRTVSFLAKAPLLTYPVIGYFVRAFDSIPVYRKQDNTTGSNRETFSRAREVLARGRSIAIFPEGTTHSDPMLRELKTGAARIALGANLDRIYVVPVGVYYTAKEKFRSSIHVAYGEPIVVTPTTTTADGEPERNEVDRLTNLIDEGLDRVTLQADSEAALDLVARAEDIFTAEETQRPSVEFQVRRWFVRGYHYLRTTDPKRLERLESQLRQLEGELSRAGLDAHELVPRVRAIVVLRLLISLPLAFLGALLHAPAYFLVHVLSNAIARGEREMVATYKAIGSMVLYLLTWLACVALARILFDWRYAIAAAIVVPLLGVIAIRVFEAADDLIGGARAIVHRSLRRRGHARLLAQREALRTEMLAIAREMEAAE